jgi:FkbM family methyltransferase
MWNAMVRGMEILTTDSPLSRWELAWTYARLKAKRKLVQRSVRFRPATESVLRYRVETGDYTTLAYLFEEIFVKQDYHFKARSAHPQIVDCGSNIGMSVLFFKTLYPESSIIAFEPDADTFAILQRNVTANNLTGVELHNKALHSKRGSVDFYYDPAEPARLRMSMRPERTSQACRQVEAVPLSDYIHGEVDFLKMDIEGAEFDVLQELAQSDKLRLVREMVVEYHHHVDPSEDRMSRMLEVLEAQHFGYQIHAIAERPFQQEAFQDVLLYAYRK